MGELRALLATTAVVVVAGSMLVSLDLPDDLAFITLVTAVAAVPFVAYAVLTTGNLASVLVGALLFVPTVAAFVVAALEILDDRQGGAGGTLAWICLPLLVLDWCIAFAGAAISRAVSGRRAAGARPL